MFSFRSILLESNIFISRGFYSGLSASSGVYLHPVGSLGFCGLPICNENMRQLDKVLF